MKTPRDDNIVGPICKRFSVLLEHSPLNIAQLSKALGYAKPSTLYAVRNGSVLPDIVRLKRLADQTFESGKKPNLNWLVTGEGEMLRNSGKLDSEDPDLSRIYSALQKIPKEKMQAILTLLD